MGLLRNTWNSTHSQYPTWIHTEFRGLMPKIPRVSSQGIRKILELFRFPHISTVFDVDFHVDFKRKKIPDEAELKMGRRLSKLTCWEFWLYKTGKGGWWKGTLQRGTKIHFGWTSDLWKRKNQDLFGRLLTNGEPRFVSLGGLPKNGKIQRFDRVDFQRSEKGELRSWVSRVSSEERKKLRFISFGWNRKLKDSSRVILPGHEDW
ncbi:unnamed protein product [Rhizophagus irregularis]|nr:unnamed protein product [Rhizophagus irregularis]